MKLFRKIKAETWVAGKVGRDWYLKEKRNNPCMKQLKYCEWYKCFSSNICKAIQELFS